MESTAPYTPEQNVYFRKSRKKKPYNNRKCSNYVTIKMTTDQAVAEAINTAAYILNHTAIKEGKKITPFEAWHKKKPESSYVKIFGSDAYVHINKQFRRKMDKK